MKLYGIITKLLSYAVSSLEMDPRDVEYKRNLILDVLNLRDFESCQADDVPTDISSLLEEFVRVAVDEKVFELQDASYYTDKIMGILSLTPSAVDCKFKQLLKDGGSKAATDWLYDYCVNNNYIKKAVLDKNPRFNKDGLIITANLAKPEFRDPDKAKSGNSVKGGYPSCVICRENEGLTKRGKSTLRTVSVKLDGQDWFWQYSPYGYFYQHGIAVNEEHIPMYIDKRAFYRLMDFVDQFPHYFIGCNAPLERIGGSVLAHDHYQGGSEKLPLHSAGYRKIFACPKYPDVRIGIVDWHSSVIRISGYNKDDVAEVSDVIRQAWKSYENKSLGIIPIQDGVQFNEISPTVYKRNGCYEMNVILRSNITSAEYPDGVFHAHPEYHFIKKESIGLIEAQGLFILPGRLQNQLKEIEQSLIRNKPLPESLDDFDLLYNEVKQSAGAFDEISVHNAVESELASICGRILNNTAVFKNDADFAEFLTLCGFIEIPYEYKITAGGRINLIGEHVDYCGGKVLPAALSVNNAVYVKANGTNRINISWTTLPYKVSIDVDNIEDSTELSYARYQIGCAAMYRNAGHKLIGCDMLYDCGVPFGSGLSSSAAIEVSTIIALATVAGECLNGRETALLAQQAEIKYAGVNCGIMDQYASANGKKDNAILLDCKSVSHTYAPINLGEYAFVIANTNKPHSLVESKYNERRRETEQALELLKTKLEVECLADVTSADFEKHKKILTDVTAKRARHVVYECERVNRAVNALDSGDMQTFGELLVASHKSLKDDYEVSCKELDALVDAALRHPYCLGSRMIGGGFGGCTLSLVKRDVIENFKTVVGRQYKQTIGYDATFYDAEISDGIQIIKL